MCDLRLADGEKRLLLSLHGVRQHQRVLINRRNWVCDMPKSVNKVILVGNVGQDPEVKYTAGGVPVAKLSLATNERFKDRNECMARQDRMAHRCRLAASGRDCGRIRAQRFLSSTSNASCRHRVGKTSRVARGNTGQRLSPGTLSCSARGTTGRKAAERCQADNLVAELLVLSRVLGIDLR